nr:hypothetical protein [uncultured Lachnoclostridium sp.]
MNGLVRVARNRKRVDANGDPVRYQRGVYDSIQREWVHCTNLGGIAEV